MWYILAGVLGAVIGSFLNVVIYRLPREGLKLWDPPYSFCPVCGHRLSWKDNVPIFSYIALRGRCRYCGAKIPIRYLVVEILNTSAYVLVVFLTKDVLTVVSLFGIFSSLIAIAFMDLEVMGIHDSLNISLAAFSLLFAFRMNTVFMGLISAAIGSGIFLTLLLIRGGMGMGDVLTMAAGGLALDFLSLDVAILLAAVTGLIYAAFRHGKIDMKGTIPFGPFLALGISAGVVIRLVFQ